MNSTHTDQFPEQTLLAELRRAQRNREIEDHTRQLEAHTQAIVKIASHIEQSLDFEAIQAHAEAAKLHEIAGRTGHQADATRAWEATMLAAEIDGSA